MQDALSSRPVRPQECLHSAQVRVPKEVSDDEAAQFLINPVTAYGCAQGSAPMAHAPRPIS